MRGNEGEGRLVDTFPDLIVGVTESRSSNFDEEVAVSNIWDRDLIDLILDFVLGISINILSHKCFGLAYLDKLSCFHCLGD